MSDPEIIASTVIDKPPFPAQGFIIFAHTCVDGTIGTRDVPYMKGNFRSLKKLAENSVNNLNLNSTLTHHGCGSNYKAYYVYPADPLTVKKAIKHWPDSEKKY